MKIAIPEPDRGQLSFPHFDDKYKCCCHTVHVKQGATIIGILSIILVGFGFLFFLIERSSYGIGRTIFELCYMAFEFLALILLFVALQKNKKIYLIPFMLYQAFNVILCIFLAVICIWTMFDPSNFMGKFIEAAIMSSEEAELERKNPAEKAVNLLRMTCAVLSTIFLLSATITAWWNYVILRCYIYLRDMAKHREPYDTAVAYTSRSDSTVY